jgi:hypothetical protein
LGSLLVACGGAAEPVQATLATGLSPAYCVEAIESGSTPNAGRCPGFLFAAVTGARDICREVGGTLVGAAEASIWAVDVNGDAKPEFVYEHDGNVTCEEAYSVFSCGSLGCPKVLMEHFNGEWREIAGIFFAYEPQQLEVLDAAADGYHTLRVGCGGTEPCPEQWLYEWLGTAYDRTRAEVRGHGVDLASSIHGLYPFVAQTRVLATPTAGAEQLGTYEAGTEVAIVGTAETADYYYVSPCNACDSGFVPKAAVRVP